MSYWVPAMSRWASNTTWLRPKGSKTAQKGAKRARHVVLGVRHVVLGLQHDVARAQKSRIPPKESKTNASRRIGSAPCRVGPPTRRGSRSKGPNPPKREQNERATSHREPAMTRWASNTTWLHPKGTKTPKKGVKRARHDVAPPQRHQITQKGSKKSAPRRIGSAP